MDRCSFTFGACSITCFVLCLAAQPPLQNDLFAAAVVCGLCCHCTQTEQAPLNRECAEVATDPSALAVTEEDASPEDATHESGTSLYGAARNLINYFSILSKRGTCGSAELRVSGGPGAKEPISVIVQA